MYVNHFTVRKKLTQHFKSTIFQLNHKNKILKPGFYLKHLACIPDILSVNIRVVLQSWSFNMREKENLLKLNTISLIFKNGVIQFHIQSKIKTS